MLKKNDLSSNHLHEQTLFHRLRILTKSRPTDTLTMKAQFKDMPSLGPGEAPWAKHEVQLREALNAEVNPPEGLEHRIWEALDAQPLPSNTTNRRPWIAAAVAGGVAVASFWMASENNLQTSPQSVPVEVNSEQVVDPVQQPSLKQALEVAPSSGKANDQEELEGVSESSKSATTTEERVAGRQKLEVMTGRESSAIPAKLDLNRNPIQSSQNQSDTVRLKGTLKLKQ